MNNQVSTITPAGSFQTKTGKTMFNFAIVFADGFQAQAAAFQPTSPWKTGETLSFDMMPSYQGVNKIKVTGSLGFQSSAAAPAPSQAPAKTAINLGTANQKSSPVHGVTVGMAINNAIHIILHNANARVRPSTVGMNATIELATLQSDIEAIAVSIIAASKRLEAGLVPEDNLGF